MEIVQKIHCKLERILQRLKVLKVIQTYKLDISFCQVEGHLMTNLIKIDSVLKRCLRKLLKKPRKAEIRNIISELVRKKNLSNVSVESQNDTQKQTEGNFKNIRIREKSALSKEESRSQKKNAADLNLDCDIYKQECELNKNVNSSNSNESFQKFLCEICGKTFCEKTEWKCHNEKHIMKTESNAKECLKSLHTLKKCGVHYKANEKEVFDVKLKQCTPVVFTQSRSQSFKKKLFRCLICKSSFYSKVLLSHHMTEAHGKNLSDKNDLQAEEPKPIELDPETKFICKCGKVFRLLKTLKKHESLKHSSKNVEFICLVCNKSFGEKGKLNRHVLSHKRGQYQCSFCSQQFARSDALKRHISIAHHPQKKFSCSFCHKKFSLKYNKNVHEENIHINANNWIQCDQCGQKFRNKITFKSHFKTHLEKQVTCNICYKAFNRKVQYQNHIKKKHFGISPYQTLLDSVTAEETWP